MQRVSLFPGGLVASALLLFFAGAVLLAIDNLRRYELQLRSSLSMEVFLHDEATASDLQDLTRRIETLTGYQTHTYRDRRTAFEQMREQLGIHLFPDTSRNPFPASISIRFHPEQTTAVNLQLAESLLLKFRVADAVNYDADWIVQQEKVFGTLRLISTLVVIITLVVLIVFSILQAQRRAQRNADKLFVYRCFGASWRHIGARLLAGELMAGVVALSLSLLALYLACLLSAPHLPGLVFLPWEGILLLGTITVVLFSLPSLFIVFKRL